MRRIIVLVVLILALHKPIYSKMIPIIARLGTNKKIIIIYFIDDECENCLKNMKPCIKHINSIENIMLRDKTEVDNVIN